MALSGSGKSTLIRHINGASQLQPLLDQIDDEVGQFTADGA
jgi:ABC-type proline/glycine betaine transport system ATPase subunit